MKKMMRTLTVVLLVLALFTGVLATTASAAPATRKYDVNGDGTTEYAYEIKTANDLLWFSQQVNGGNNAINGVLMNDIDLSTICSETLGNWTPIGNKSTNFKGNFDGRGFTVKNLYYNDTTENGKYVGLFGYFQHPSTIRNVTVTGTINAYGQVGGIVGGGTGYAGGKDPFIINCVNYVNITCTNRDVGGILGISAGEIRGCVNYGNITAANYVGGIMGFGYDNIIRDCANFGTITGGNAFGVGHMNQASCKISNFLNMGTASSDPISDKNVTNCYSVTASRRSGVTTISADDPRLVSGELAYLLGGTWGQEIGVDATPVPGGKKVYKNVDPSSVCSNPVYLYSNTEDTTPLAHDTTLGAEAFTDGVCNNCGYVCTHPSATITYSNLTDTTHDATYNCCNKTLTAQAHSFSKTGLCPCGTQAAATVNGEFYLSIDEAFTKAQATENAMLVLLDDVVIADVEIIGTFTLDLNGFTLKSTDNYIYALRVTAGHLTIKDSVGTGSIVKNGKGEDTVGASDNGSVTIYGGNFGMVNLQGNGTFEIYGGKFDYFFAPTDNISIYCGEFMDIRGNGKLLWNFLSPDGFYYDADGNLLDARESRILNNVTVKQGADLSNAVVTINGTFAYLGAEIKPDITVTIYGKVIDPAHYTVTYSNNVNVGTEAVITVTGKDPYSGSNSVTFEIAKGSLKVETVPETTFEFGDTYVGKAITGGKVVIVGNESAVITGTWTWVEGTDTATFTPDAQYADLFETLTDTVVVTQKVTAATPVLTIATPSPSIMPGMAIRMSVVVYNPHNTELTDLPTQFRITYKIGENGTPVTVDGLEFTLPTTGIVLGDIVYVTVENVAVSGKYTVATSVNTIELTVGQVDYNQQIKALEAAIEELKNTHGADVSALEAELAALKAAVAALDDTFATDQELADAIAEVNKTIADLADRVKVLEETYATKAELEKAIEELEALIADGDQASIDALNQKVNDLMNELAKLEAAMIGYDDLIYSAMAQTKAELEALITEAKTALEAAIAALEDRVEQNEADIAALQAALAAAIENLNKAIADGDAANTAALAEAVATLEKALADAVAALETADETNRNALEALISETKTTLEAALAEAVEKLEKADADNKTALEQLITDTKAALEVAIAALEDRVEQNEADIAALQAALAAAIENLNKAIAEGDAANAAALAEAVATLEKALADAVAALETADETNRAALEALISEAKTTLEAALTEAVEKLEKADADNKAALEQLIADTKAALETITAALEGRVTQNESDIAGLQEALQQAIADLNAAIISGDAALAEKIADLGTALDHAIAAYQAADKAMKAELSTKIEAADAALQAAIDKLTKDLANAEEELNAAIASGDAELDSKIAALSAALDQAIAAYQAADATQSTELTNAMKEAVTSLEAAIKQVQKNLDDVKAELAARDSQIERLATIACAIAGVALCGSGAFVVWFFIDRKKKI